VLRLDGESPLPELGRRAAQWLAAASGSFQ